MLVEVLIGRDERMEGVHERRVADVPAPLGRNCGPRRVGAIPERPVAVERGLVERIADAELGCVGPRSRPEDDRGALRNARRLGRVPPQAEVLLEQRVDGMDGSAQSAAQEEEPFAFPEDRVPVVTEAGQETVPAVRVC